MKMAILIHWMTHNLGVKTEKKLWYDLDELKILFERGDSKIKGLDELLIAMILYLSVLRHNMRNIKIVKAGEVDKYPNNNVMVVTTGVPRKIIINDVEKTGKKLNFKNTIFMTCQ
eukprot:Pgem_evm1s4819